MKLLIAVIVLSISETLMCILVTAGNWIAALTACLLGVIASFYIKWVQS